MFNVSEWLNLIFRWAHVFSAILWVGTTYYFTWLDGQMRKMQARSSTGESGELWMLHSGGFYTVVRQKTLGVPPGELHWFRFEALSTFLTGFILLNLVYYHGGLMVDALNPRVSPIVASLIGLSTLVFGWIVYDVMVRTALSRNDPIFGTTAFVLVLATLALLMQYVSARAAYIHIGALFGTIMTTNVWMRILPPQRKMVAAAVKGETFDPALAIGPKLRSKHNTFLAVPTTFIMISNHFPTATYGNHYAVWILGGLILVGWGAAWVLRRS